MTTKESILNEQLIQNIIEQEGEQPYWLDSPFYDIYWEWINDTQFIGGYNTWIRAQITEAKNPERIERLADALAESLKSVSDGNLLHETQE